MSSEEEEPHQTETGDATGIVRYKPKGTGKKKIALEYISDREKRRVALCKRKSGICKKLKEIETLTGADIVFVMKTESGQVYSYNTEFFATDAKTVAEKALNKT